MSHQPRIIPTRPGKWYVSVNAGKPEIMRVIGDGGHSVIDSGGTPRPIEGWRGLRFIAPIPGPAVCAALAEYVEALADLDALWNGADFITRNNVTNLAYAAGDALDAAIRAERDGGA